ncbi:hypothetical protein DM02DRAFT_722590 [Periconia macrospinosa]|uniref:AB hydrolase-1 domain-containing protein n=1 Tax=Periconia macrospinosa TaxID=97972 RepID=A0A2V1CWS3_9PLEO|nr:hypothetical protein DM02DRAFT_722590 [Periconia macrospinosa]
MLVGQSNTEYVLIEAVVYVFGYLGLLCLTYFSVALAIGGVPWVSHPFSIAIETIGAIEILFYLFWYLPYVNYLRKQRPRFSSPLHREQRRDFLQKSLAACSDVELFVKGWMCGASLEDVRRENLKDWFLWALFDREGPPLDDDEELEEYVRLVEEALGRNIGPGWGPADSVRLNFQHLDVSHRSLVYYCIIGFVDFTASIVLLLSGFSFYRQPRSMFLRTFPFRPLTLFSPKVSASPHLSYFCRPHKSKTHRPIVFIHGLGIGVSIYIPFFLMLPKDVGILGIEFLPVTSHITDGMPVADDLVRDIRDVISQQMTSDFVFVGNSYGTFITKLFIESPYLAARMSKIVLIDPVAVLLQLPDLAYNFTKRKPSSGRELAWSWSGWKGSTMDRDF